MCEIQKVIYRTKNTYVMGRIVISKFWHLSPFKCPFIPEMGHISESGQIRNTFALPCYFDHFGSWWSNFDAHHGWPHHPSMTGSDSYPLSKVHLIQKWVISVTQDKFETFALPCYGDHFGSLLSILVYFGAYHGWPHHPSMAISDFYPLSSVHFGI